MDNFDIDKIPFFKREAFYCPHCGVYAKQYWDGCSRQGYSNMIMVSSSNLYSAQCSHCDNFSLWLHKENEMIYPKFCIAPKAHKDMPDNVMEIFEEARLVSSFSHRATHY